jgi:hypothetical protein
MINIIMVDLVINAHFIFRFFTAFQFFTWFKFLCFLTVPGVG